MSTAQRIQAVIEIERGERTIRGEISINDAFATRFYGWLELIDTLERATSQPATPPRVQQDNEAQR